MKGIKVALLVGIATLLAFSAFSLINKKKQQLSAVSPLAQEFTKWMQTHKITFNTPKEYQYRLKVYGQTDAKIKTENAKQKNYVLGHNKFSHLTEQEFIAKYTGLKISTNYKRKTTPKVKPAPKTLSQSPSVDWRTQGAVNPVKDQGQCGSCWAFSATASIEAVWKTSGHNLENLAEQQFVDCSTKFGNQGCNGGLMDDAFKYLMSVAGQERTSDYPYTAKDGVCKYSAAKAVAKISGYADVPKNDCKTLFTFATNQVTSVAIAANAIQSYKSGVFSNALCGTALNHGVAVVGYGHDNSVNKDFWIVRNSWGANWGEQGYIRMDRNVQTSTGICGICMAASAPKA